MIEHKKKGRKPIDGISREEKFVIKLSKNEIETINDLSERLDIPKTVLVRNLYLSGLDDLEYFIHIDVFSPLNSTRITSDFLKKFTTLKTYFRKVSK